MVRCVDIGSMLHEPAKNDPRILARAVSITVKAIEKSCLAIDIYSVQWREGLVTDEELAHRAESWRIFWALSDDGRCAMRCGETMYGL